MEGDVSEYEDGFVTSSEIASEIKELHILSLIHSESFQE